MKQILILALAVLSGSSQYSRAELAENKLHLSSEPGNAATTSRDVLDEQGGPKFCAAVRGNGQLIFAHFASLARVTESYGTLDMIAGGSSGSVSAFIYESMLMNDAVNKCKGGVRCTPEERARRVALLLKSTEEYLEVLKQSKEGKALLALAEIAGQIMAKMKEKKVEELLEQGLVEKANQAIKDILEQKEFISLLNPEILKLVNLGRTQEVIDQVKSFGNFKTEDNSIFFRPGLFNFEKAPDFFGKIADFYAGRGISDQAGMEDFLNECAVSSNVGRLWEDLKTDPKTVACTKKFNDLARIYRENYKADGSFKQRSHDKIGAKLPTLISTSVIDDSKTVQSWKDGMRDFWENPKTDFKFDVSFDKVKFGYWGRPQDLKTIKGKFRNSTDLKSQKFLPLGPAGTRGAFWTEWEEALKTSPAEPGLAAIQPIGDNRLSIGGWSDLHPTLALRALGCKNIVYITREGEESEFAVGVARLLGMSKDEERQLYKLGTDDGLPPSSFQRSVNISDAIWCTDWNTGDIAKNGKLIKDSYFSTLVTDSPFFEKPMAGSPTIVKKKLAPGCASTK